MKKFKKLITLFAALTVVGSFSCLAMEEKTKTTYEKPKEELTTEKLKALLIEYHCADRYLPICWAIIDSMFTNIRSQYDYISGVYEKVGMTEEVKNAKIKLLANITNNAGYIGQFYLLLCAEIKNIEKKVSYIKKCDRSDAEDLNEYIKKNVKDGKLKTFGIGDTINEKDVYENIIVMLGSQIDFLQKMKEKILKFNTLNDELKEYILNIRE